MGEWCVNILRFAGNFVLFGRGHGTQRTHIVKSVGNFNQNDAYVFRHSEEEFAKILGLLGSSFGKNTP